MQSSLSKRKSHYFINIKNTEHEIDSHNKQIAVRNGHWVDLTKRLSKESLGLIL